MCDSCHKNCYTVLKVRSGSYCNRFVKIKHTGLLHLF